MVVDGDEGDEEELPAFKYVKNDESVTTTIKYFLYIHYFFPMYGLSAFWIWGHLCI